MNFTINASIDIDNNKKKMKIKKNENKKKIEKKNEIKNENENENENDNEKKNKNDDDIKFLIETLEKKNLNWYNIDIEKIMKSKIWRNMNNSSENDEKFQ